MSEVKTVKRKPPDMSPHSEDDEAAVLGSILMNPAAYWDVEPHLAPDDFFIVRHGWIYDGIRHIMTRRDMGLDTRTLATVLRQRRQLDDVGGESYLNYLMDTMPTALHAEYYAVLVEEAAVRRRLIGAAGEIAKLAHDEKQDTSDALNESQRLVMDVSFRMANSGTRSVADVGRELYDRLEKARLNNTTVIGVPSPYADLDKETGGWQPSDLVIIAGRPGMGKSAMCLQVATHAASQPERYHVLYCTGEMDSSAVVQRVFAQRYGVPMQDQRRMTDEQWHKFHECLAWWDDLPVYVNDSPGLSPLAIARECREHKRLHGRLDLVIVDYLQRFRSDRTSQKKHEEVAYIAQDLKELAREFRVPVIAAAQLSRACEARNDKRPLLSDLAESGAIEREADIILFPFREGYYTGDKHNSQPSDNVVDLDVAKHRNGETPVIPLIWDGPSMTFRAAAKVHVDLREL